MDGPSGETGVISIQIEMLTLEPGEAHCEYDNVTIYDGMLKPCLITYIFDRVIIINTDI